MMLMMMVVNGLAPFAETQGLNITLGTMTIFWIHRMRMEIFLHVATCRSCERFSVRASFELPTHQICIQTLIKCRKWQHIAYRWIFENDVRWEQDIQGSEFFSIVTPVCCLPVPPFCLLPHYVQFYDFQRNAAIRHNRIHKYELFRWIISCASSLCHVEKEKAKKNEK